MPPPAAALRSLCALALFGPLLVATSATAAPILLESGTTFLEIDPLSADHLTGWTVNGVAHVRTQSFWLGDGAGPERSLASVPLLSSLASDADGDGTDDSLALVYEDATVRVTLAYVLTGSAIGDPAVGADLALDVTLEPLGASPLRLVQYTDVDLFTSFVDDVATIDGTSFDATVTDASGLGGYTSSSTREPSAVDAALYDVTLASLLDGAPTSLGDSLSAAGDVTLAYQWSFGPPSLAPDGFSQLQSIRVVPEPGTALLALFGLAALALRRQETAR
jgi:MYXO-CTERM domain-containing protein